MSVNSVYSSGRSVTQGLLSLGLPEDDELVRGEVGWAPAYGGLRPKQHILTHYVCSQ